MYSSMTRSKRQLPPPGRYRLVSPDDELAIDTYAKLRRAQRLQRQAFEDTPARSLEKFCQRYGVHLMPLCRPTTTRSPYLANRAWPEGRISHGPRTLFHLRDLHLPDALGWWPLAPGWWVVIGNRCRSYSRILLPGSIFASAAQFQLHRVVMP